MLQRTEEWYQQRAGKFTASDIHRILGKETLATTKKSINTIALEKAKEIVFGIEIEDSYKGIDIERGIELEPLAFEKFKQLKGLDFIDVKEVGFIEIDKNSGASPDGLVYDIDPLEIKCPRKAAFFNVVCNEYIDPKYYAQMQMQMLATGGNKAYYFPYMIHLGKEYYHEIIVERDEIMINLIKERVKIASKKRDEYIDVFKVKMNIK